MQRRDGGRQLQRGVWLAPKYPIEMVTGIGLAPSGAAQCHVMACIIKRAASGRVVALLVVHDRDVDPALVDSSRIVCGGRSQAANRRVVMGVVSLRSCKELPVFGGLCEMRTCLDLEAALTCYESGLRRAEV